VKSGMGTGNSRLGVSESRPYSASLLGLKWRGLVNSVTRGNPWGYVAAAVFVALVVYGEWIGVLKALEFVCNAGRTILDANASCSIIGRSIASRVLESGLIVLAAGVTFSAVTTAITTLYTSDDLNFLLAQPLRASRVFAVKLFDTYLSSAGVPSVLTIPPLLAIGAFFSAAWWYYPLAVLAALITYVLPVALGAAIAIALMRFAPAGRVREVATGLGVIMSASLVYLIRAAKPEELLRQLGNSDTEEAINRLIETFGSPSNPLLPSSWASSFIWSAARGDFTLGILLLTAIAALMMLVAGWLATQAYLEGWVRGLESSKVKLDPRPRGSSRLEGLLGRFGAAGHLVMKDARLLFRDATQWSQLLILVALGGVYVVSVRAFPIPGEADQASAFRNALGFLTLAFQGFVIAGVGVRMAFPSVSQEGYGYWLLRTAPISTRGVVMAKFWGALPATLILAVCLGYFSATSLNLSPVITLSSVLVAFSSAFSITALGVGIGAAVPRFKSDNPAEIAFSAGGLIYMVAALFYSGLLVLIVARPAYLSIVNPIRYPALTYFASLEGALVLGLIALVTVLGTILPLWYGWTRLDRHE
jgi:ABC-2 type transport system permease protein